MNSQRFELYFKANFKFLALLEKKFLKFMRIIMYLYTTKYKFNILICIMFLFFSMTLDTGAVYACGDTKYGKLCISDCDQTVRKPCKIDFPFSTLKVTKVSILVSFT